MVRLARKRTRRWIEAGRDEETVAALPASVYSLRSVGEIEALLAESGFVEIHSALRAIGGAHYAFTASTTR